eukprot:g4135.t1
MPERSRTQRRRSNRITEDSAREVSRRVHIDGHFDEMEDKRVSKNVELELNQNLNISGYFRSEMFQMNVNRERETADRLIPFPPHYSSDYSLADAARRQNAVEQLRTAAESVSSILIVVAKNDKNGSYYCTALQSEVLGASLELRKSDDYPKLETSQSPLLLHFHPTKEPKTSNGFQLHPLDDGPLARVIGSTSDLIEPLRQFCKTPYKILDAPGLKDDFYYNLIHWSSKNILAVGLGKSLYMWIASSSAVEELNGSSQNRDEISSLSWSQGATALAMGTRHGHLELWDPEMKSRLITFQTPPNCFGCLSWNFNMLASGCRDKMIRIFDPRNAQPINVLRSHQSEVCGLQWSIDNVHLVSGGNDNRVCVWDIRRVDKPLWKITEHKAAVKAVTWSPHKSQHFATGGGLKDRTIKTWNLQTQKCTNSVDTDAQVCGLHWSENVNELVSTHGYNSYAIKIWKVRTMESLVTIPGHSSRIVYMTTSPDGTSIATGAGDESVRFFTVFPSVPQSMDTSGSRRDLSELLR